MQSSHSDPIMPSSYILLETYIRTYLVIGNFEKQKIVFSLKEQESTYRYFWRQAELELTPGFRDEFTNVRITRKHKLIRYKQIQWNFNEYVFLSYTLQGIYPSTDFDCKLSLFNYQTGDIKCPDYLLFTSGLLKNDGKR